MEYLANFAETTKLEGLLEALSASAQFGQQWVQTCYLQLLADIHRRLVLENHMIRREVVCFTTITT